MQLAVKVCVSYGSYPVFETRMLLNSESLQPVVRTSKNKTNPLISLKAKAGNVI